MKSRLKRLFLSLSPVLAILLVASTGPAQVHANGAEVSPIPPMSECANETACRIECQQGNGNACLRDYNILKNLDGRIRDSANMVEAACNLEQALGCLELGKLTAIGVSDRLGNVFVKRDPVKAQQLRLRGLTLLSQRCENGFVTFCMTLADFYYDGAPALQIDQDQSKANELFRKACDKGDGYGCYSTGFSLKMGHGVAVDEAKSKDFFKKACAADNGAGCAEIGETSKACRLGSEASCDQLCDAGNWTACEGGGRQSQAKAAKRKAEKDLPGLFAFCMTNRGKIEKLRVAGVQAARTGNIRKSDEAMQKLKELEPVWSETLDKIRQSIDLVTLDAEGARDPARYMPLMRRVQGCSCEPTRSGRCR